MGLTRTKIITVKFLFSNARREKYYINLRFITYLHKFKMYNFSNCTAEHCVCAIFCRVSHRVKSPITTPNDLSLSLQFIHQVGSVSFPVSQNSRKQELALVHKVCSCTVYTDTQMFEYKEHFADRCTCHENGKA